MILSPSQIPFPSLLAIMKHKSQWIYLQQRGHCVDGPKCGLLEVWESIKQMCYYTLVLWLSQGYNHRVALLCKVKFNLRPIYYFAIVFAHYKLLYSNCTHVSMPWHCWQDPEGQATIKQIMEVKIPTWKNGLHLWQVAHILLFLQLLFLAPWNVLLLMLLQINLQNMLFDDLLQFH